VSLPNRVAIDREHDRQQHLRRQLTLLKNGQLWSGPGTTYPALDDLDERIATLTEKIDRLQRRHVAFMEAAERLLSTPSASEQTSETTS
jgi:hypothetical protein